MQKHRGAALIVALFIMTLVATAAVLMIERMRIDTYRAHLLITSTQNQLYAQGSIAWAMEELNMNWRNKQPHKIIDKTPIHSPVNTMGNASISSTLYDAQSRFNLNNLSNNDYKDIFLRLLHIISPTSDPQELKDITTAITNWIMPDDNAALDRYYTELPLPYKPPHKLMTHVSELRLVKGVTSSLYTQLLPYVIALPEVTPININNAEVPVLMSLSATLTQASALAFVDIRKQSPVETIDDFLKLDLIKNNAVPSDKITVTSNYFLVETNVTVGDQVTSIVTLMQRILQNAMPYELVIWQSKGSL